MFLLFLPCIGYHNVPMSQSQIQFMFQDKKQIRSNVVSEAKSNPSLGKVEQYGDKVSVEHIDEVEAKTTKVDELKDEHVKDAYVKDDEHVKDEHVKDAYVKDDHVNDDICDEQVKETVREEPSSLVVGSSNEIIDKSEEMKTDASEGTPKVNDQTHVTSNGDENTESKSVKVRYLTLFMIQYVGPMGQFTFLLVKNFDKIMHLYNYLLFGVVNDYTLMPMSRNRGESA